MGALDITATSVKPGNTSEMPMAQMNMAHGSRRAHGTAVCPVARHRSTTGRAIMGTICMNGTNVLTWTGGGRGIRATRSGYDGRVRTSRGTVEDPATALEKAAALLGLEPRPVE